MKAIYPILLGLCINCSAFGEKIPDKSEPTSLSDEVQKAIQEFNLLKNKDKKTENEVVVVISPSESKSVPQEAEPVAPIPTDEQIKAHEAPNESTPGITSGVPQLVTGKPPVEISEKHPEVMKSDVPAPQMEAPLETAPTGKQGLEIRVESIREGTGLIDPGQVKLKASFPAKSLSSAPDGWILEKSDRAPMFREVVTLRPGKTITLEIQPHILIPSADGASSFSVVEPGFEVSEGYRQSDTVSAILGNSVAQLDRDALLMGNAISNLHQLLASLPKPIAKPEDAKKP